MLYVDKTTTYVVDEFWAFKNILECSHSQIHMRWLSDMNNNSIQLIFVANGEKIWVVHEGSLVDRDMFASIVTSMKT